SFIESLLRDTAASLRLARQRPDGIREVVYVYLCRAYEARLAAQEVCNLLGTDGDCVLNRANLEDHEEEAVLDAYGAYDALLRELYSQPTPLSRPLRRGRAVGE